MNLFSVSARKFSKIMWENFLNFIRWHLLSHRVAVSCCRRLVTLHLHRHCSCLLCKYLSLFLWTFLVTIQEDSAISSFVCCLCLCLGLSVSFSFLLGLLISIGEDTSVCLGVGMPGGDKSSWRGSILHSERKACSGLRITVDRLWQS